MVMTLSSGSPSRMAASTAVSPRLMPCPSIEMRGGRYWSLRRLPATADRIGTPRNMKPKKARHKTLKIAPGEMENDGMLTVTILSDGTYFFGNDAPNKYCLEPLAVG